MRQKLLLPVAKYWLLGLLLSAAAHEALACQALPGEAQPVVVLSDRSEVGREHGYFYRELLELALEKTRGDFGPCQVRLGQDHLPAARMFRQLAEKRVDIIDGSSSPERNRHFREIPIPLLKGLMGYRIFFIRSADRELFADVDTLAELQELTAGQGAYWPDVQILRDNGLPVVPVTNFGSLFRMLEAGRIDYLPRGAQEVLDEKRQYASSALAIEPGLILAYPSPVFFYVNRDAPDLAHRVETGLRRAIEDGSFDALFYSDELIESVYRELQFENRRIIYLCNGTFRDSPILADTRLWVQPWPPGLCASQKKT